MAERGDVFHLKRRLGFHPKGEAEAVVIIQATPLNAVLPTLVVVQLDPATGAYGSQPAVVRVSRQEAGSSSDQVAVPWQVRAIPADALGPGPVGRLSPRTLAALDQLLRLVLALS
jgi:mRNA-degrading endonuclease toxin of MazEF toxin-antitoxin module